MQLECSRASSKTVAAPLRTWAGVATDLQLKLEARVASVLRLCLLLLLLRRCHL